MTTLTTALLALATLLGAPAASGGQAPEQPTADDAEAKRRKELEAQLDALRQVEPEIVRIERVGLRRDPAACRALLPLLRKSDGETRVAAARALGWCGDKEAVDPLIASLGVYGWSEAAEAALFRLDADWRTRPAVRRVFEDTRERWFKKLRTTPSHDMETKPEGSQPIDPLLDNAWAVADLLVRLDEERAKDVLLERMALPADGDNCPLGLWLLDREAFDPPFAEALERSLAGAPDLPCLEQAARRLDDLRPEWRNSDSARAAAEIYALRRSSPTPQDAAGARQALALLGDSRADEGTTETTPGEELARLTQSALEGRPDAIAGLQQCAVSAGPPGRLSRQRCVEALGGLGRADLVDTYRALLAEPPPPEPESDAEDEPEPDAEGPDGGPPPVEDEGDDEEEGDDADAYVRRMEASPEMQRYFWAARRADAVRGLGRALGGNAFAELQRIATDPDEEDAVVSAVVEIAAAQEGPEWSQLLAAVAARADATLAMTTLARQKGRQGLPLVWAAIVSALAKEDDERAAQLVGLAVDLAPQETAERLRLLAQSEPAASLLLASVLSQPKLAASTDELLDALSSILRPAPGTAPRHADSQPPLAAIRDLLHRLAEGPVIARSRASTLELLAHDPDAGVRALARYVLWRADAGR